MRSTTAPVSPILVGYDAAHKRVKRLRGSARDYVCVGCGDVPATDWAYNHEDENELAGGDGPYSLIPANYDPMCKSCHKVFDLSFA